MSLNELIDELDSLPLAERVKRVADDIDSRNDRYSAIPPHELAKLLNVPSPEKPDGDWVFTSYVERVPVEDILDSGAGIELLEGVVPQERYEYLSTAFERGELDYTTLTPEERRSIEDADMEKRIHECDVPWVLAHFTVCTPDERELKFEGLIECDGECIDLLGPYDDRNGLFKDLSDCLTGW